MSVLGPQVHCIAVSRLEERRRQWHPTPVLLPGKSRGWRSLVGCSPQGCAESDTTARLHFHYSLACTGGGNGNLLQYSCLENPSGLPSMGSHRVGHDWCDLAAAADWEKKYLFHFTFIVEGGIIPPTYIEISPNKKYIQMKNGKEKSKLSL